LILIEGTDHVLLSAMPMMIFGPLNAAAWVVAGVAKRVFGVELAAEFHQ
jgi:hypothetical protein